MKAKMYSEQSNSYLHHHIIDGFKSSHEGIKNLKQEGIIREDEYTTLLEKNVERLIDRIREFRMMEKMMCIFFAILFGYMQISGDDQTMIRNGRSGRTGSRTARGARSGRKNTDGIPIFEEDDDLPCYV
jgi:hypothetical protein